MLRPKYNLLFVITDQQRYDAIGYINSIIKTPHLDHLASQSIVCDQAIVQSPQCQPSRASFLTGKYPDNIQMWWNETRLNPRYPTIANYLSNNGYLTGYFGKLHIDGDDYKQTSRHFGFEQSYLSEDWIGMIKHNDNPAAAQARSDFYSLMRIDDGGLAPWTGVLSSADYHHEQTIIKHASDFLQCHNNKSYPFACFVSFHGPHPPYCCPPPYCHIYQDVNIPVPDKLIPTWFGQPLTSRHWHHIKSQYYGAISWIDNYIGQLLSLVDLDNTIVVFVSDHGDILGDHGLFSKGVYTFEGNIRVPLIISIPGCGHIKYDHTVQLIDLLPTILSALGLDKPTGIDGVDLVDALINNHAINEYAYSAISTNPRHYMIRSKRHKLCVGDQAAFYDLSADPLEATNTIYNALIADQVICMKTPLSCMLNKFNNQHSDAALRKLNNDIYHN